MISTALYRVSIFHYVPSIRLAVPTSERQKFL